MALDANTYGTVARVEALVGDLVASRTFGSVTIPTLSQVETFLDDIAVQLNMELERTGYTVPVSSSANPQAFRYLRYSNSCGAAALVLSTMPVGAYTDPTTENGALSQGRRHFLERQLSNALKIIREGSLPASRSAYPSRVYAGSQEDEDGNKKLPIFTRSLTDYPASRSLTEEA